MGKGSRECAYLGTLGICAPGGGGDGWRAGTPQPPHCVSEWRSETGATRPGARERPPLLLLAYLLLRTPWQPRACQGGPGWPSGFSGLGRNPSLHPLRHPPSAPLAWRWKGSRRTRFCVCQQALEADTVPGGRRPSSQSPFKRWHQGVQLLRELLCGPRRVAGC